MEKEEQLRTLAAEADIQQRRAQDIQNQVQQLQMTELEVSRTIEALKNLKEKGTSLFGLGSGVFVRGSLKEVEKLLVNVGSNVFVEKKIDGTIKFLEEKKGEIADAKEELMKGIQAISGRLKEIDVAARGLLEKKEK